MKYWLCCDLDDYYFGVKAPTEKDAERVVKVVDMNHENPEGYSRILRETDLDELNYMNLCYSSLKEFD